MRGKPGCSHRSSSPILARVSRLQVVPFSEDHVPDAGRLLAARHRRHRSDEPLLPAAHEDPEVAAASVAAAFREQAASGAVAVRGGRVVGFLLGAPKPSGTWGPNVWVESAEHAVERAEDVRDLYAAAATRWVEEGRTAHYAVVPAHDPALVAAWFRLAFGHQHTHGIREVAPGPAPPPAGTVVRRGVADDAPALAHLDLELPRHQALAPTFSAGPRGSYEESLAELEQDVDDPAFATFVAEVGGRVVGSAVGCSLEVSGSHTGPARPENAGFLGFAAVLPAVRGRGVGHALGEAVLAWCAEQRHTCVVTDWRETNLLSSRAWPALGFRPSFVRVHRLLGH